MSLNKYSFFLGDPAYVKMYCLENYIPYEEITEGNPEADIDIKCERFDNEIGTPSDTQQEMDVKPDIKTEPIHDHEQGGTDTSADDSDTSDTSMEQSLTPVVPAPYNTNNHPFRCKVCSETFSTRFAGIRHCETHPIHCLKCKLKFPTLRALQLHFPSCTRRFGLIIVPRRAPTRQIPSQVRKFKCKSCHRSYVSYQQMYDHRGRCCRKRSATQAWGRKA